VPVYLIQQDQYFDREQLYGIEGKDYIDNCERFVFFSRAVLEAIRLLDLPVDIIHANDWQTGLVPAYLKVLYSGDARYEKIASVFAIHNMAYQGQFWHWDMLLTRLDWKYFNWHQMEFHGKLNLLKTGLVFADALVTVSPRYAQEIQSAPLGYGLEGVLQYRRESLSGILNGIDENEWNPATDKHLPERYNVSTHARGKAACKAALQKDCGLPQTPGAPLVAFIGRLDEQKGIDLIADVMHRWVTTSDVQWVVLGTGQPKFQKQFESLAARFPDKVSARMEFSNALAHRIEAGADIFLMPSKYEPCGLNQMYSLRYGTVPIVRETGGLADTIVGYGGVQAESSAANGFTFQEYSALSLSETLRRACDLFRLRPAEWKQLVETGMSQDLSWGHSARKYVEMYETTLARLAANRESAAVAAP
jgi:starch synthase